MISGAIGRRMRLILVAGIAAAGLLGPSCGDDGTPGPNAVDLNEAGWASYAAGDVAGARQSFSRALETQGGLMEARLGLAWCEARQGDCQEAIDDYDAVIESGQHTEDAYAGRAAAALAIWDHPLAVASAGNTLARNPAYAFERYPAFEWRDLRLIVAQACFALAEYAYAQAEVDIIDPDNGLDEGDPETWVVAGKTHPTYQAALAMEIEYLWYLEGDCAVPGSPYWLD
jgi:tetratricopeptide (TPR) repeat protein